MHGTLHLCTAEPATTTQHTHTHKNTHSPRTNHRTKHSALPPPSVLFTRRQGEYQSALVMRIRACAIGCWISQAETERSGALPRRRQNYAVDLKWSAFASVRHSIARRTIDTVSHTIHAAISSPLSTRHGSGWLAAKQWRLIVRCLQPAATAQDTNGRTQKNGVHI